MSKGREIHASPVVEHVDFRDWERLSNLSISTTSASLPTGTFEGDLLIESDIDCFFRNSSVSASDAQTVSATNGFPIRAHERKPFFVKRNHWLGFVTETGTGTVKFTPSG